MKNDRPLGSNSKGVVRLSRQSVPRAQLWEAVMKACSLKVQGKFLRLLYKIKYLGIHNYVNKVPVKYESIPYSITVKSVKICLEGETNMKKKKIENNNLWGT